MLPTQNSDLLKHILAPENLLQAWKRVRKNKGAAGIDGLPLKHFAAHIRQHAPRLIESIQQGSYTPYPVKRVYIEKESGGWRGLGIPTVFDRILQQAIVQILSPKFDPTFSDNNYGFRPGRSQHHAVKRVQDYVKQGRKIAVDVDLAKFFDRVNHDVLMSLLGQRIRDKAVLKLIGQFLRAGVVENGCWHESTEGVPQGGPLSPLLSNVVLDVLDKELERRQHNFARYADDFIILVKSKRAGNRVLKSITQFVERKLKLKVNDQKSRVVPVSQCKFLGFTFYGTNLKWHNDVVKKFKHNVKNLTGRSKGIAMGKRIKDLTVYLRGWINYFGIALGFQRCVDFDKWIRRRLRMCYWKEWKRPGTRVKNLIKLGVAKRLAIACGISSKSYWHSAKTEGIHKALPDTFFMEKGLISLESRWVEIHYR